ncbi:HD-GYP domain-containing protein [Ornithinimicrobium sp. LYQ92]|uniref:HD-GYP domain-containing protein n=1 Tax=Serinicoccus sp. LYQ92 TaxID=3378798 RepID=UPI0038538BA4
MRVAVLVGGMSLAAAGLVWWTLVSLQPTAGVKLGGLAILLGLAIMGVLLRERGLGPSLGVSVATVVMAAAIPVAGPVGAATAVGLAYLADVRARTWRTRLFNTAMTALMGAVGGVCYILLGGVLVNDAPNSGLGLVLHVGLPLVVAYAVMTAVNVLCIGAMSAAVRGTPVLGMAGSVLRSLGWGYMGHVVIGFLFVVLWGPVDLGATAALFVLGPLLVAHWTIGREALARREHQETVTTFVAALEQSDPASVGHSARVADLAEALGSQLGVRGPRAEELLYAALLHDIGMVVVRPEMPADPRSEEVSFLGALSAHPQAGVSVLGGLDFLESALPAIRHHHERWDGRGYPSGLSGEEIPLAARIIAVADAFDALTSAGATGPEAVLEQLEQRTGSHLDPAVVAALRSVLDRPLVGRFAEGQGPRTASQEPRAVPDHDHPDVSDSFADWQLDPVGPYG